MEKSGNGQEAFSRTRRLLGGEAMDILAEARVAIFGIGGVGGYVAEALARSGVGELDLIDNDTVCPSNINRQLIADTETLGRYKADVMAERIRRINPKAVVHVHRCFYLPENRDRFDFTRYSYVVDAVDTVAAKIGLVMQARESGVPIISSMGAGNKLDPSAFQVADIYRTSVCPLARVMRRELKKRGVTGLKVVYSKEEPLTPFEDGYDAGGEAFAAAGDNTHTPETGDGADRERRAVPGSVAFVPPAAGLILAGEVVRDLTRDAVERARARRERSAEGPLADREGGIS